MEDLLKFKVPVRRSHKNGFDVTVKYKKYPAVQNKKPTINGHVFFSKKFMAEHAPVQTIAFSIDKEQKEAIIVPFDTFL